MSYNLENFTDYIGRENEVLTATLFAGGDTSLFARYMTGIKGSTEIPQMSGTATLQAGTGAQPQGSTVGTLAEIKVVPFTVYEGFDQDELQTKFPNTVLAPGSNNAETPKAWEEALVNTKIASIASQLEVLYWQGDTAGTDHVLFDGFLKKIDASNDVIAGNTSDATEITVGNVKQLVDDMRIAAPAIVKRDAEFIVAVGDDTFDKYIAAEKAANLYHYQPEHDNGVYRVGGSGMKLHRVYGLDGSGRMVATVGRNLVVGSDVENENQIADMWYDKTSDKTYLRVKAKAGVQIVNPKEIVEFTLAV